MPLSDPSSWPAWVYAIGSVITAAMGAAAALFTAKRKYAAERRREEDTYRSDQESASAVMASVVDALQRRVESLEKQVTEIHESYQKQYRTMEEHWQTRITLIERELGQERTWRQELQHEIRELERSLKSDSGTPGT